MKIEVWSDVVSPFCCVGQSLLEQTTNHLYFKEKISIQFRSYELDSDEQTNQMLMMSDLLAEPPDVEMDRVSRGIQQKANELGLICDVARIKPTESFDAHRLVKAAEKQGKEKEMIKRLLKAYFIEGKPINDLRTLIQLANDVRLNLEKITAVLESRKYSACVADDEEQAREIGIENVPFFVFNETYAVAGVQPVDVLTEVMEKIWEEECQNPTLKSLALKKSATSYCTGGVCQQDKYV